MNWLKRNSALRSSFARAGPVLPTPVAAAETAAVCFETFCRHWQSAQEVITRTQGSVPSADDVDIVHNHVEQLIGLLVEEFQFGSTETSSTACLDVFLSASILQQLFAWSSTAGEFTASILQDLLTWYAKILTAASGNGREDQDSAILSQSPVLLPLQSLLETCKSLCLPFECEKALIHLLHHLCKLLTRDPSLLAHFFQPGSAKAEPQPSSFTLFSLLVPYAHQENGVGDQARNALKLCMSLAKEKPAIGAHIAQHSDFCPVVATGLSGLYSRLPARLPRQITCKGYLTLEDANNVPELSAFVASLEFCDAVLQCAPDEVKGQLLEYVEQGFLVPVIGPALHQNTSEEIVAATCYLHLCMKRIEQRALLGTFIRFLLTQKYENVAVMDTLVQRLNATAKLRLATLSFFNTLLELHCEDVLLELVFKHLLPGSHLLLSQRALSVQLTDTHGFWASYYLSLIPQACQLNEKTDLPRTIADSPRLRAWSHDSSDSESHVFKDSRLAFEETEFNENTPAVALRSSSDAQELRKRFRKHLKEARTQVKRSLTSCDGWEYKYDGGMVSVRKELIKEPPDGVEAGLQTSSVENAKSELPEATALVLRIENEKNDVEKRESEERALIKPEFKLHAEERSEFTELMEELEEILAEMDLASPSGESSGYDSLNWMRSSSSMDMYAQYEPAELYQSEFQHDLEFWSMMHEDDNYSSSNEPSSMIKEESLLPEDLPPVSEEPCVGPFLELCVRGLEGWLNNSIPVNIALCSVLSKLASYPQPLLKSYLLNPFLVLHPEVPSLAQALSWLKQRIDSVLLAIDNPKALLNTARQELVGVPKKPIPNGKTATEFSPDTRLKRSEGKKRSISAALTSMFKRTLNPGSESKDIDGDSNESVVQGLPNNSGFRYVPSRGNSDESSSGSRSRTSSATSAASYDPIARHVAECAVLLEAWLYELAALCLEHAVAPKPVISPAELIR